MSRLTKKITYSLKDRGYKHNGQNRDDLDIKATIALIRSPKTQELVKKGGILGFYGHQIRELLGLNPPETAVIDGREIRIEPALKTTLLEVDDNGNVTHQQQFFENEAGEHAFRQYKAGIGGFSSAFFSPYINGKRVPQSFHGFDFVLRPNYDANRGNGMFDSLDGVGDVNSKYYLEQSILTMYDHMQHSNMQYAINDFHESRALSAEKALERELSLKRKRKNLAIEREKQRKEEELLSQLLDSVSLEEYLAQSDDFLTAKIETEKKDESDVPVKPKMFNLFG